MCGNHDLRLLLNKYDITVTRSAHSFRFLACRPIVKRLCIFLSSVYNRRQHLQYCALCCSLFYSIVFLLLYFSTRKGSLMATTVVVVVVLVLVVVTVFEKCLRLC